MSGDQYLIIATNLNELPTTLEVLGFCGEMLKVQVTKIQGTCVIELR